MFLITYNRDNCVTVALRNSNQLWISRPGHSPKGAEPRPQRYGRGKHPYPAHRRPSATRGQAGVYHRLRSPHPEKMNTSSQKQQPTAVVKRETAKSHS